MTLFLILFPLSVFADDSDYVDIGLSYNNVDTNTGMIYANQMYLEQDNEVFNLYVNQAQFKVENGYRVLLGEGYVEYADFTKAYQGLLKIDSEIEAGFGNGYRIYSKNFKTRSLASDYVNQNASEFDCEMEIVEINESIYLKTGLINTVIEDSDVLLKTDSKTLNYDNRNYRGDIRFSIYNHNVSVVNHVQINDYLYGVLPTEMDKNWPLEALKAQAVVARTYLIKNEGKYSQYGFDLCDTSSCQVYGGYNYEGEVSNKAVDDTNGEVVTYNGQLIYSYYHSSSGGFTANSENVWMTSVPYLRGVADEFSNSAPNTSWAINYTESELVDILRKNEYNVGSIKDIFVDETSTDGRVQKLVFETDFRDIVLEKEEARKVLGYNNLKSIFYSVSFGDTYMIQAGDYSENRSLSGLEALSDEGISSLTSNQDITILSADKKTVISSEKNMITFRGRGWGHGIGLSQWGAKAMAEQGYKYDEIIKFYYTGVELN